MSKILSTSNGKFITINNVVIRIPTFTIKPGNASVEVATADIPYDIGTPTWKNFVNSSYNTDNHFFIFTSNTEGQYIMYYKDTTHQYTVYDGAAGKIRPHEIIIENDQYFLDNL